MLVCRTAPLSSQQQFYTLKEMLLCVRCTVLTDTIENCWFSNSQFYFKCCFGFPRPTMMISSVGLVNVVEVKRTRLNVRERQVWLSCILRTVTSWHHLAFQQLRCAPHLTTSASTIQSKPFLIRTLFDIWVGFYNWKVYHLYLTNKSTNNTAGYNHYDKVDL